MSTRSSVFASEFIDCVSCCCSCCESSNSSCNSCSRSSHASGAISDNFLSGNGSGKLNYLVFSCLYLSPPLCALVLSCHGIVHEEWVVHFLFRFVFLLVVLFVVVSFFVNNYNFVIAYICVLNQSCTYLLADFIIYEHQNIKTELHIIN